ncbi:NAD(P)-binding domain-containing protein [Alcanivorax sp. S6407]|uniref:flavin-containing monooxygenase n=1 Tax=Alcanivorax sp. S6407 TaxID=2926424 RepID=UPI001FF62D6F|nr:NAD(P)-binding domain-containing protein [Alcanivorax sp. S6407]MCK0154690.1 NAD(P)-binding domain-containing protein [Alcanivorax sp. S6407]
MYAVIGAGPMGLATARNLKKYDIPFIGFDLHSDVGGLWDIDNPHSTMYESAHLISSKGMTEFKEFPMADSVATYPHHSEMKRYFQGYARQFGLYENYEFSTRVESVEKDGDGWQVTTSKDGEQQTRRFEGVLIANGTLHKPNMPSLPGEFEGELMHSSEYRSADVFAGKRVLVVGCGNSACDIAVDAVHRAASVDMSVRRGYYFLPKFIAGKATDSLGGKFTLPRLVKQKVDGALIRMLIGKPSDYGLPDPDYKLYESHPVINSLILHHLGHGDITPHGDIAAVSGNTVTFADGQSRVYDLILMGTGYKLDYPFIDAAELNWQGQDAPQLYLNVFHPEHRNLFIMGMVEAAGLGWEGRNEQAEMVALYLRAKSKGLPEAAALEKKASAEAGNNLDGGLAYLKLARMAYYVHKDTYRKAVGTHISDLLQGV